MESQAGFRLLSIIPLVELGWHFSPSPKKSLQKARRTRGIVANYDKSPHFITSPLPPTKDHRQRSRRQAFPMEQTYHLYSMLALIVSYLSMLTGRPLCDYGLPLPRTTKKSGKRGRENKGNHSSRSRRGQDEFHGHRQERRKLASRSVLGFRAKTPGRIVSKRRQDNRGFGASISLGGEYKERTRGPPARKEV